MRGKGSVSSCITSISFPRPREGKVSRLEGKERVFFFPEGRGRLSPLLELEEEVTLVVLPFYSPSLRREWGRRRREGGRRSVLFFFYARIITRFMSSRRGERRGGCSSLFP